MKFFSDKSTTTFEKIIGVLVVAYIIAAIIACNVNLDIFVYAGFGTYVIIGLIAFIKPGILFEVLRKENEEYLARNPKKIPLIKAGFRYGGFALSLLGCALTYVFIIYY
ncbi:MAG: hypothetical protein AWM53_00022 [Candidatus Dichloromethanomonas elyunquensis]|nr:MAG: hypothetical protein AWM53_00022 [Candidatus Dichloromethanomonas elyunquensis]